MSSAMAATAEYLTKLLLFYEEEIMGEFCFYGLAGQFDEPDELELLARNAGLRT